MTEHRQALVVGAGISGLAAAYELGRRGRDVLVLEAAAVGGGQSAGLARIFRVAHRDPELCALALEARAGWRRWERDLGAGRLLGDDGLVVAGAERAAAHGAAMRAAGVEARELTRRDLERRIPFLRSPWDTGLWDGLAGSLRVRRALTALARRVTVRHATVQAVEDGEQHALVRLDDGDAIAADVVLVCAGLGTHELVVPAGLDVDMRALPHVRLSYRMREPAAVACLIAAEGYGVPLGSTGCWALGLHDDAPRQADWVPRTFPGLDPQPVGEIRCVSLEAPWLDGGDGFVIRRAGRIIALAGGNLMKFGPVLGERLARAAA